MKAPDKIYVASNNGEELSHSWNSEPIGETTTIEYVSKNRILEMVKDQKRMALGFAYEHLKMLEDKIKLL